MKVTLLKSKIHRASVTEAKLDYIGSISIDEKLLQASGILEYEKVQVVNINNGARFETYTIATQEEGVICLNGAAARLVATGDKIIIMAYADFNEEEAKTFKPKVVFVDENNMAVKITNYEKHGSIFNI
ncbi:aspartate 1-decarboxylase [Campylobacter subantarcticus LMG 24377]|uniref:Aspartate 1-decarboxylase n=2 Tax=Campylobacter subantarcticus TaxID=497724 RepID=A0A0A8HEP5_9BACT|nr:aspartate 1-decarboxylase [Campylobacter subantarcticus]EAJ1261017.1 aspartate 1-decarboxylase [Campylobacter lari]AJC91389.1 aspartate 1-decarboxylase [Campylobacter subantarcticus LMG 24374]AJC93156.1 aspartate 1-decarboxylase [Campylobacter subantarcticus LMG 24377]EAJ1262071.1 aspartate 1-decarboxylase [Campylobacter lari]EAL3938726.1 aspartate 1-decarboxylase [Campylobacter lari]